MLDGDGHIKVTAGNTKNKNQQKMLTRIENKSIISAKLLEEK